MRLVLRYSLFGILVNSLGTFLMSELIGGKLLGHVLQLWIGFVTQERNVRYVYLFFPISFVFRIGFCSFLLFGCFWCVTHRVNPFFFLCSHISLWYIIVFGSTNVW